MGYFDLYFLYHFFEVVNGHDFLCLFLDFHKLLDNNLNYPIYLSGLNVSHDFINFDFSDHFFSLIAGNYLLNYHWHLPAGLDDSVG